MASTLLGVTLPGDNTFVRDSYFGFRENTDGSNSTHLEWQFHRESEHFYTYNLWEYFCFEWPLSNCQRQNKNLLSFTVLLLFILQTLHTNGTGDWPLRHSEAWALHLRWVGLRWIAKVFLDNTFLNFFSLVKETSPTPTQKNATGSAPKLSAFYFHAAGYWLILTWKWEVTTGLTLTLWKITSPSCYLWFVICR